MENVISLNAIKVLKAVKEANNEYVLKLKNMEKIELLEEAFSFSNLLKQGGIDDKQKVRGIALMNVLRERAVTPELKNVADIMTRKLSV